MAPCRSTAFLISSSQTSYIYICMECVYRIYIIIRGGDWILTDFCAVSSALLPVSLSHVPGNLPGGQLCPLPWLTANFEGIILHFKSFKSLYCVDNCQYKFFLENCLQNLFIFLVLILCILLTFAHCIIDFYTCTMRVSQREILSYL